MKKYSRFNKFPELKRFMELGGQHTKEGEEYLAQNPQIYNQAVDADFIYQLRVFMGDNKVIHEPNSLRS